MVSTLVFRGATFLSTQGNAPSYAGSLLAWYLDGNAGEDKTFQIEDIGFSDAKRLAELLEKLPPADGEKVIDPIYRTLLPMLYSAKPSSKAVVDALQATWVDAFEAGGNWFYAFSAAIYVKDYTRAASVVKHWADVGFKSETPLFFARCALYLFSEDSREAGAD